MGFGGIPITYTLNMRDSLPYLVPPGQTYSIWAILREAIGKDLSRITMPIFLNEPLSMLQKTAEMMQYNHILEKAKGFDDECRRIGYGAIHVISQYSTITTRNRKPFNPMLGETYELLTPEWRWFTEQVSHHPPISAFHAEGDGWYTYGNTNVKNFFWGGSLEIRCIGLQHMFFTRTNDHYIIQRPENSANNLILGTLYVDLHGKMDMTNLNTGSKANLYVHRQGWTKRNAFKVEGKVIDGRGVLRYEVFGTWNKQLSLRNVQTGEEEVVWNACDNVPNYQRQYGFCHYTINLNYLNESMKQTLPPTDTRWRMDQRLMEEGTIDLASKEKHRLEEKQRATRKIREEMQIPYKPMFFEETEDEISGEKTYIFTGEYWERRKKLDYRGMLDLY